MKLASIAGGFALSLAVITAMASANASARSMHEQSGAPMLLPESADLVTGHFTSRCTRVERFARDAGKTSERSLGVQQLIERPTTYRGKPAVLLVVSGVTGAAFVDSALVYRNGLAPITESYRAGKTAVRYDFAGRHVRITSTSGDSTPVVKEHDYPHPVFNFQQLDAVIRSLPLRTGYAATLPLYSEGDDSVEVDTVRVQGRSSNGAWQVRFVDPAVVAITAVDEKSRAEVEYSHRFRQDGPSWKRGAVWRQVYSGC